MKTVLLSDIGAFKGGVTSIKKDDYGYGTPFITYKNIFDNSKIDISNLALMNVPEKDLQKCSAKYGDIFFTASSETFDEVAMSSVLLEDIANLTFNGFSKRFRLHDFKTLLPQYARYLFRSPQIRTLIAEHVTGDTRFNISQSGLGKIKINVPRLSSQEEIASILAAIDEKIELNRRMNETSEKIGQALFKHYFIDNPEAKTWQKGKLGEITVNFDSKRVPLSSRQRAERKGPYRYYGATSIMDYVDDYIFDGRYLLLAEDGSVTNEDGTPVLQYLWDKFWVNNHTHVLQAKAPFTVEYLYLLLSQSNVQSLVSGAVQLKINQKALNSFPVSIPPKENVDNFNAMIEPTFAQIRNNSNAIDSLTKLRDSLLPRLISGKIKA